MSNDTDDQKVEGTSERHARRADDEDRGARTRGLRSVQTMERRLSRAGSKLARALEEGFSTYRKERDKSADDQKDGAILDFVDNFAAGFRKAQEESGAASEDIISAFSTNRTRKRFRQAARTFSRFFPFMR